MGGASNSCNAYAEGGRLILTTAGADAVRFLVVCCACPSTWMVWPQVKVFMRIRREECVTCVCITTISVG